MRLDKVLYLCTIILNYSIMVQGKKQLNVKPKFAEVVIGDNEAKEMRESEIDKKAETIAQNISEQVRQQMSAAKTRFEK